MNQPPHAEYPRPAGFRNDRGPGVYFEAIGEAWGFISRDLGHWVAATIVYLALGYATGVPIWMLVGRIMPISPGESNAFERIMIGLSLLAGLSIIPLAIQNVLLIGMVSMGIKKSKGEYINVGMMFEPFGSFGRLFFTNLLLTFVVIAATVTCFFPVLFFAPVLMLMPAVAYFQKLGPLDALTVTFNACKSHWAALLALAFLLACILSLGTVACGIGFLFALPLAAVTLSLHYRAFFEVSETPFDFSIFR